jgi:hypothetical protein
MQIDPRERHASTYAAFPVSELEIESQTEIAEQAPAERTEKTPCYQRA